MGFVRVLLFWLLRLFFREIDSFNSHKIPAHDPVLFVCAPHANQFIDPLVVSITAKRHIGFLTAAVSMRRRFIGLFARSMGSIPVERPQDLAGPGAGTITVAGSTVTGIDTTFTASVKPGDSLSFNRQLLLVDRVVSDTELVLKEPPQSAVDHAIKYKIVPKVDQSDVYDKVYDRLHENGCVGIFPEGGSHDRTTLLPLKAGFCIMALGAIAKHPGMKLKIVPTGLNYFRAHRFRSACAVAARVCASAHHAPPVLAGHAYVDFGDPIQVPDELVDMFRRGGVDKRKACEQLLSARATHFARPLSASAFDLRSRGRHCRARAAVGDARHARL